MKFLSALYQIKKALCRLWSRAIWQGEKPNRNWQAPLGRCFSACTLGTHWYIQKDELRQEIQVDRNCLWQEVFVSGSKAVFKSTILCTIQGSPAGWSLCNSYELGLVGNHPPLGTTMAFPRVPIHGGFLYPCSHFQRASEKPTIFSFESFLEEYWGAK